MQRTVANVIISVLQSQDIGKTYRIHAEYLDKVNHNTIIQSFAKSTHILWSNNVNHEDVLLFVSDTMSCM